jgi:hypothetical protein
MSLFFLLSAAASANQPSRDDEQQRSHESRSQILEGDLDLAQAEVIAVAL